MESSGYSFGLDQGIQPQAMGEMQFPRNEKRGMLFGYNLFQGSNIPRPVVENEILPNQFSGFGLGMGSLAQQGNALCGLVTGIAAHSSLGENESNIPRSVAEKEILPNQFSAFSLGRGSLAQQGNAPCGLVTGIAGHGNLGEKESNIPRPVMENEISPDHFPVFSSGWGSLTQQGNAQCSLVTGIAELGNLGEREFNIPRPVVQNETSPDHFSVLSSQWASLAQQGNAQCNLVTGIAGHGNFGEKESNIPRPVVEKEILPNQFSMFSSGSVSLAHQGNARCGFVNGIAGHGNLCEKKFNVPGQVAEEVPKDQFLAFSLGRDHLGKQGNTQCDLVTGIAAHGNLSAKEFPGLRGNFDLSRISKIDVASEFGAESVKDRNLKSRGNGKPDILQSHQRKFTPKAQVNFQENDWSMEQRNKCLAKNMAQSSQIGSCALESQLVEDNRLAPKNHKDILLSSGWMVASGGGSDDSVYVSPSGQAHGSLPKPLEAFSRDASKIKEKVWGSSRSVGNSSLSVCDLGDRVGPSGGNAAKVKRKRSPRKRAGTRSRVVNPVIQMENNMIPRKRELEKELTATLRLYGDYVGSKEIQQVLPSSSINERAKFSVTDGCLSNEPKDSTRCLMDVLNDDIKRTIDVHQNYELLRLRRSSRINGKHVPVDSELDMPVEDVNNYFGSPLSPSLFSKEMGPREIHEVMISSVENEKGKSSINYQYLSNGSGNWDCCRVASTLIEETNEKNMHGGASVGVERSVHFNGEDIPLGGNMDMESNVDYLSSKCAATASSLPEDMKPGETHNVVASCNPDEKAEYFTNDEILSFLKDKSLSEADKSMESCRVTAAQVNETSEPDDRFLGVWRPVHMDNKHVNLDAMLDRGMETNDICSDLSGNVALKVPLLQEVIGSRDACEMEASCVEHEKETFFAEDEHLDDDNIKHSECCRMVAIKVVQNSNCTGHNNVESLGVGRSKLNDMSQVLAESDMDVKIQPYDDLSNSSKEVATGLTEDIEDPMTATLGFEETKDRMPTLNKKIKQNIIKKFGCREVRSLKQLESKDILPLYESRLTRSGVKTPVYIECSPLPKRNRRKMLVPEKRHPSSTSKRKSVGGENSTGKKKNKRHRGYGLRIRRRGKEDYHEKVASETKVTMLSWLIDAGVLTENERVMYKKNGSEGSNGTLRGWVTRGGILCNCCKKVMSLLAFEAHAGSDLHQQWDNICLISGKSLMQCLCEAWEKEKNRKKVGFQTVGVDDPDPSDDTCGVCGDGGHLIICDNCPSTFHQECVMLKSLPKDSWYCPYCKCAFCMMVEQENAEATILLTCNQCGCKYHEECSWQHDMQNIRSLSPKFCGENCKKVSSRLSDMLGVPNPIGEGFSWTLLRRFDEDEDTIFKDTQLCVAECNVKLSLALSVLNECFSPLVDTRTGLDMIAQVVYNNGSNFNRLNYERFHTVVLEKEDEIISVATLRLHGTGLAEMPLIGTRPSYQQQGMCRRLLKAIEDMLSSLCVEKLIIPAIPDLVETWMKSFSFKPLELSHKEEIRNLNMMVFTETTMLHKPIPNAKMEYGRDVHMDSGDSHTGSRDSQCWSLESFLCGCKDADLEQFEEKKFDISATEITLEPKLISGSFPPILPDLTRSGSLSFPSVDGILASGSWEAETFSEVNSLFPWWSQSSDGGAEVHSDAVLYSSC